MTFSASSPVNVPAAFAVSMSFGEAMTFSVSSRSTLPMMAMLGSKNNRSSFSLMATYCVPEQFSMYQLSCWSVINSPAPSAQP